MSERPMSKEMIAVLRRAPEMVSVLHHEVRWRLDGRAVSLSVVRGLKGRGLVVERGGGLRRTAEGDAVLGTLDAIAKVAA